MTYPTPIRPRWTTPAQRRIANPAQPRRDASSASLTGPPGRCTGAVDVSHFGCNLCTSTIRHHLLAPAEGASSGGHDGTIHIGICPCSSSCVLTAEAQSVNAQRSMHQTCPAPSSPLLRVAPHARDDDPQSQPTSWATRNRVLLFASLAARQPQKAAFNGASAEEVVPQPQHQAISQSLAQNPSSWTRDDR